MDFSSIYVAGLFITIGLAFLHSDSPPRKLLYLSATWVFTELTGETKKCVIHDHNNHRMLNSSWGVTYVLTQSFRSFHSHERCLICMIIKKVREMTPEGQDV